MYLTEMSVFGKGFIEDPKSVQELISEIEAEPGDTSMYICDDGDFLVLKYDGDVFIVTKYLAKEESVNFDKEESVDFDG